MEDGVNNQRYARKLAAARRLCGGLIVEVTDQNEGYIAQGAGAKAVLISSSVRSDQCRMPNPTIVNQIKEALEIPIIVKIRAGHWAEAQIMESVGRIKFIDECEVTSVGDNFIHKSNFKKAFISGCPNLPEALKKITEGSVMIRTPRSGDILQTVECVNQIKAAIVALSGINLDETEMMMYTVYNETDSQIVSETIEHGRLPVPFFAAGGITTPADAALMMHMGCDGVFISHDIFYSSEPAERIKCLVRSVEKYSIPKELRLASMRFHSL